MSNTKYSSRNNKLIMAVLADTSDRDSDSEKLDELRHRTIQNKTVCEHGCQEVFDATKGFKHDLPGSPLFCSNLCAYRHKKRTLAMVGVIMK
jgi:hypothetical protein